MKRPLHRCVQKSHRGFTLVEVMVVMVVFMMLVFLLVQATTTAQNATAHQVRQMDATGSARVALDTLTEDINTLVTRGGTTLLFKPGDAVTNDTLKLVSVTRNSSETAQARMSVVSYFVETRPHPTLECDLPMLVRGSAPLYWPADGDPQANDYQLKECLRDKVLTESDVVAERVFRFEISWLRQDGTISRDPRGNGPSATDTLPDAQGFLWVDLKEVRGFLVSVVALDGRAEQQIASGPGFPALQARFPAMPNSEPQETTSAGKWLGLTDTLPGPARQNARILQRTYYLPQ